MPLGNRTRSLLLAIVTAVATPLAHAAAIPQAATLLEGGHADQALLELQQILATHSNDADALNLECRVYFSEGRLDAAQGPCESAVANAPNSSQDHLWLGRVFGREAEHAPALSAFSIARQAHAEFETAYRLNPHNADAVEDLANYYVHAPRLLGGGNAKATALADAAAPWDPALAHRIRAEVATENKDQGEAERELMAAATSRDGSPDDWVALAAFYRQQGDTEKMLEAIDKAVAIDTAHDAALVAAAEQLTLSHQRPAESIALLRNYLASPNESESAPAFLVHARLAALLMQQGDARDAGVQLSEAHALASQWQPRQSPARTGA